MNQGRLGNNKLVSYVVRQVVFEIKTLGWGTGGKV